MAAEDSDAPSEYLTWEDQTEVVRISEHESMALLTRPR
jgi:hypothetical protein